MNNLNPTQNLSRQPELSKPKKIIPSWLGILIITIIAVSVALMIFVYFKYFAFQNLEYPKIGNITINKNLTVFKSDLGKFQISYPKDLIVEKQEVSKKEGVVVLMRPGDWIFIKSKDGSVNCSIRTDINKDASTSEAWAEAQFKKLQEAIAWGVQPGGLDISDMEVDGVSAKKAVFNGEEIEKDIYYDYTNIYFMKDSIAYWLGYTNKTVSNNEVKNFDYKVCDEIFSTFRFTENYSDWKKYINDEYGFEFQYPSNFTLLGDIKNNKISVLSPEGINGLDLEIMVVNTDKSLAAYVQDEKVALEKKDGLLRLKKEISFAGKPSIKLSTYYTKYYVDSPKCCCGCPGIGGLENIYLEINGKILNLSAWLKAEKEGDYTPTLQKILSSFKFI